MNAVTKTPIATMLIAALGLFAAGVSWGAIAAERDGGIAVSADSSATDTGLHERREPAGGSICAYDEAVVNGVDCRLESNSILADCAPYLRAHAQDYSAAPDDRSVTVTGVQRGGHIYTNTHVWER